MEFGMKYPYALKESTQSDRYKFYRFFKIHGHKADKCIYLKDEIKDLIKKERLNIYT